MKKRNQMTKQLIVSALILTVSVLQSCKNKSTHDFDREIQNFFIFVLQLTNVIFVGLTALLCSIISNANGKRGLRQVAGGFIITFAIFSLITFQLWQKTSDGFMFYTIYILTLAMIVVSFIFWSKWKENPKTLQKNGVKTQNVDQNEGSISPEDEIY